jgi:NAD(P)-dependent dehydrogenase (short-subunit alcohol dehydrogenase family)
MGRLDGKVAVITGAASGIGQATALRFAREGATLVAADLNAQGGERTVSECAASGAKAVFQRTDVSSETDIKAAIDRALDEFGRLDILFNNAGFPGPMGPIEAVPVEDWDRTMAVLLRAPYLGMKYAIPAMRRSGGGSIITTASDAAVRGLALAATYSAAKAAVVMLSQSVAIETGPDRIRVNCVCPGRINTPLGRGASRPFDTEIERQMAAMQPIPRAGQPEDVANLVLFLASDESEFITGCAYIVDGGRMTGSARLGLPGMSGMGFVGPSFQR